MSEATINNFPLPKLYIVRFLQHYHYGGWWEGWSALVHHINTELYESPHSVNETFCRNMMNELKDEGIVQSKPIWGHNGKLNGRGWFLTDKGRELQIRLTVDE